MKKIILFLSLAFLGNLNAQLDYKLDFSTSTYSELLGATDISVDAWSNGKTVSLPFGFDFWGRTNNNVTITFDGIYFSDTSDEYIFYGTDNFMPKFGAPNNSPISYLISGTSPNRIFKVQYKDVSDSDYDTSWNYSINVQLWLHENGNKLEFHFGNSSITDPNYNKNYIGIIHYSSNPYYAIDGTSAAPTLVRVTNAGTFDGIASFPVSGQVYTLSQTKTSIKEEYVKPYAFKSFNNSIEIESDEKYKIEVIDINGRATSLGNLEGVASNSYDLSNLASGIYVLKISIGNAIYSEKITVL
jgi:hypothetical protein